MPLLPFSPAPTTTAVTQAATDNSTLLATDAFVQTVVNNAIAGVNPAASVNAATTQASDSSGLTYNNGASGIGATLTGTINTAYAVDGYTFTAVGQRLLVKNDTQSPSGAFNGVYSLTVLQTGILAPVFTRALDFDTPSDMNNTGAIPVISGSVNGVTQWLLTSTVVTVGTTSLSFTKFTTSPTTPSFTSMSITGSSGTLNFTASSDGGDYNIYSANGSQVLAFYGSTSNTLNVALLDGYLEIDAQSASTALTLDSNKRLASSTTTSTELGYVHNVTSAIQTQLNLLAPLASPTLTGTPLAPTAVAGTNSTQIATTAYVEKNIYLPNNINWKEDFTEGTSNNAVTTSTVYAAEQNWHMVQVTAGTQTIAAQPGTFANPGQVQLTSGASTNNGLVVFRSGPGASAGTFGALGSNAAWESHFIFKLVATTSCAIRIGFCLAGQNAADPPTAGFYMEYDTANTGHTDTNFTWVTRTGSASTYSTTNTIAADTSFHHLRIRSTSSGTIGFTIDGGTELGQATGVDTGVMTMYIQTITRTTAAKSCIIDFVSYLAATGRT